MSWVGEAMDMDILKLCAEARRLLKTYQKLLFVIHDHGTLCGRILPHHHLFLCASVVSDEGSLEKVTHVVGQNISHLERGRGVDGGVVGLWDSDW